LTHPEETHFSKCHAPILKTCILFISYDTYVFVPVTVIVTVAVVGVIAEEIAVESGFIEDEIDVEERRGDCVCGVIGNAKVRGSCVSRIIWSVKEKGTVPSIVWLC